MSNSSLLRRIQFLEAELASRDRESAVRESAARDVAAKISTEQRDAARAIERQNSEQNFRRAAWINEAITHADPESPFDMLAIEASIPADPTLWPVNFDRALVVFDHVAKAERPQLDDTIMGKIAKGIKL